MTNAKAAPDASLKARGPWPRLDREPSGSRGRCECQFETKAHFRLLAIFAAYALLASGAFALDFQPYRRGDFAKIVKAHTGKPLILHYWSVTCPPCLAELPQWKKILSEHKDVDVVFVNTDGDEDRARAEARLEKAGLANAAHYGFADDFAEKLYFEADKTWRGEMPFTALVSPDGGVVTVTGAVDDPLIVEWLRKRGAAAK